jgi:hypothetical protein
MHWSDASTGLVASYDGSCRTTDGGQSWGSALFFPLFRVSFRDALHGYVGSYLDRRLLETTDGGVTWSILNLPWERAPYDLQATPEGFVICGEGSTIIGGTSSTTTGVPGGAGTPPLTRLDVVRVWPNPSRGRSITLGIESPVAGPVELRIYDVGGRLIRAMIRRVAAGPAEIAWSSGEEDLGTPAEVSGIYFVEARFANGEQARGRFVLVPEF